MRRSLLLFVGLFLSNFCFASVDHLKQARFYLKIGNYWMAMSEFQQLDEQTLSIPDVRIDFALANTLECTQSFNSSDPGLEVLLNNFNFFEAMLALPDIDPSFCIRSDMLMESIDPQIIANDMSARYQKTMNAVAIISFKIKYYADTDKNGVVDPLWDPCGTSGSVNLPSPDLDAIAANFYDFVNFGHEFFSEAPSLLHLCEETMGVGNCNKNVNTLTNPDRWFMRAAIAETKDGIGLKIRAGYTAENAANPQCEL